MRVFKMEDGWYRAETDCHPFMGVEGATEEIVRGIIDRFVPWYFARPPKVEPEPEGIVIDAEAAIIEMMEADAVKAADHFYEKIRIEGGPIV